MSKFNLSVIVTAIDETWSLERTVDIVIGDNGEDVLEIIIAIAPRTTLECRKSIKKLQHRYGRMIRVHEQSRLPFVGGAVRECFEIVDGRYTVIMAGDLETDPVLVKELLLTAKKTDADVVATSRWLTKKSFSDYSKSKFVLNWIFQKMFSLLFMCYLTDMTYGYRLYRTAVVRSIKWEENKHAFFFESIIKPLRLGYRIVEIPARWRARQEGTTHISTGDYIGYFKIGFKVRFRCKKSLSATLAT
jgi:glycosyltransferase involved in cell wall biosynthesis